MYNFASILHYITRPSIFTRQRDTDLSAAMAFRARLANRPSPLLEVQQ